MHMRRILQTLELKRVTALEMLQTTHMQPAASLKSVAFTELRAKLQMLTEAFPCSSVYWLTGTLFLLGCIFSFR